MAAYEYHVVREYESSSSDAVYTVCIRVDTRIADPTTRRQRAILSCNCAGWTRRCLDGTDASRRCRHVKQEAAALEAFRAGAPGVPQPPSGQPEAVAQDAVLSEPPPVRRGRWAGLRVPR